MTDAFMADEVIREKYGITGNGNFENTFSSVSVESILFFIVASAIYVLESLFELFRIDVEKKVETSVLASIPWYHKICMEYQHGDELVYDESTGRFKYPAEDRTKQVIKFAACRDKGGGVDVLVSGADSSGAPIALSNNVLTAFKSYLNKCKPAGVIVSIHSYNPDEITMTLQVQYDVMLLNPDGSLISDSAVFPVENAINEYLKNITYGGVFNKTKLIDAVQSATGVVDVLLNGVIVKPDGETDFAVVSGNNYTANGGAFKSVKLKNNIQYVVQL